MLYKVDNFKDMLYHSHPFPPPAANYLEYSKIMISKRHNFLKAILLSGNSNRNELHIPWRHVLLPLVLVLATFATVSHVHADDLTNSEDTHESCEALHHSLVDQAIEVFFSIQVAYFATNQPIMDYRQSNLQKPYFKPPARAPPLFS